MKRFPQLLPFWLWRLSRGTADIADTAVARSVNTWLRREGRRTGGHVEGQGPFTVLPDRRGVREAARDGGRLLKDTEKLKQILLYHVVAGKVMASDVVKLNSAKTCRVRPPPKVMGGKVMIDNANGEDRHRDRQWCDSRIDSVILPK